LMDRFVDRFVRQPLCDKSSSTRRRARASFPLAAAVRECRDP
jgi:hypothetical protein